MATLRSLSLFVLPAFAKSAADDGPIICGLITALFFFGKLLRILGAEPNAVLKAPKAKKNTLPPKDGKMCQRDTRM